MKTGLALLGAAAVARFSQYDLGSPPALASGQKGLWVMKAGGPGRPEELTDRFTVMSDAVERVSGYQGRHRHRFWGWRL